VNHDLGVQAGTQNCFVVNHHHPKDRLLMNGINIPHLGDLTIFIYKLNDLPIAGSYEEVLNVFLFYHVNVSLQTVDGAEASVFSVDDHTLPMDHIEDFNAPIKGVLIINHAHCYYEELVGSRVVSHLLERPWVVLLVESIQVQRGPLDEVD